MGLLDKLGVEVDSLGRGKEGRAVGFQTPTLDEVGTTVRNLRNYDSITSEMVKVAVVPDKLTKKEVVQATNSAKRALAQNVHKAKWLTAQTIKYDALVASLKMEAQAKQKMQQSLEGVENVIDVYGRTVEESLYKKEVLEEGYKAYRDELRNGGQVSLGGW